MQALRTNVSHARREGLICQTVPLEDGYAGEHLFHLLDAEGSVQGASCVTRDQDWAVVNYMLSSTRIGTYLLHAHVVSAMQQLGVRHLLITSGNALRLNPGLLYLQARLGYSVVNLHLARTPRTIDLAELRRADHALELRLRAGSGSGPASSQGEGIWCPPGVGVKLPPSDARARAGMFDPGPRRHTGGPPVVLGIILFGLDDFRDHNDFHLELWPAYQALYAGHLRAFINLSPSYIGAVVWRAPFALVAMALGAGWRVTYFVTAVPCLVAVPLFGVWFASRSGLAEARSRQIMLLFAGFAVANPVLWYAGILGHPEELVGTVLALAAVVFAAEKRILVAMVLVALAVLNKPGLVEIVPVVVAARRAWYSGVLLALGVAGSGFYALYNLTSVFAGVASAGLAGQWRDHRRCRLLPLPAAVVLRDELIHGDP